MDDKGTGAGVSHGKGELSYPGKAKEQDIILKTLPASLKKVKVFYPDNPFTDGWSNMLIRGDNLSVLKTIYTDQQEADTLQTRNRIRLVYIDPPFSTKRNFKKQDCHAYQDTLTGAEYIEFLRKRLILIREILANNGSLYVHLDFRAGHYIKIIMDEVFGEQNFVNECIWHFSSGGRPVHSYARKHAVLFYYKKGENAIFHPGAIGKQWGRKKRNNMKRNMDADGRIYWSITSGKKEYRYYEDDILTPDDVWHDINHLQQKDPERARAGNYPTQKPEKLLERIITASSDKDDIVLDAFAGSGTTLAVSEKLGRRWIGIDSGDLAIRTIQKRLQNLSSITGSPPRDERPDYERVPGFEEHSLSGSRGLFFIYEKARKGELVLTDTFFKDFARFLERHLKGDGEETFSLMYPEGKLQVETLDVVKEKGMQAGEQRIRIRRITFLLSAIRKREKGTGGELLKVKEFSFYKV
ncbi:MAG: site-specific DNA-methyltransferase [Spirochaetales bacterium]|nr:site-specific DNA-methyltransferase [Spirochaetales bacterium]